jgi:dTDP-4-dehydrorhamnose reductase
VGFRVLLTDHQSSLGAALLRGFEVHSLPLVTANTLEPQALSSLCEQLQPAVIVHPAHIPADENLLIVQALGHFCRERGATLIYLSSHEVFGVAQHGALAESDTPEPDTETGRGFFAAEQSLESCERKIILRLPWLLDVPNGLLDRLCQALIYSRECVVSDSWRGSPVLIEDVVRMLLAMVQQVICGAANWGCFHLHASDHCSEAELADHVARVLQKAGCEVGTISLGPVAQRFIAANGWIKGQRCTNNFGFQYRSWRQGIKSRIHEWLEREIAAGRLTPAVSSVNSSAGAGLAQE